MCLNAFEEFDLEDQKRKASKKELRLESRRQRREAIRRLDRYIRELPSPSHNLNCEPSVCSMGHLR